MLEELLYRFFLGGTLVALFAAVGSVCKPKTFAGLFGAAPSVALATLGLTYVTHGHAYVATEARSMLLATPALLAYCEICIVVARREHSVRLGAMVAWLAWLAVALLFWAVFRGGST
ncbi:hypothetical protein AKJ09_04131 [Labilithrix luteola]|uniref:DUF3147 family protein n=1 Tax=Labilithrix luteola TaxID=1391654 RepID=A0A0K1PVA8_9BACT|nr:DUF3147 family protein [Labilithrix luteola]AKU97467.1 hypothetical protein AKJ09_04131 [Labilithrix luteola]